jgi:hypothetical protein
MDKMYISKVQLIMFGNKYTQRQAGNIGEGGKSAHSHVLHTYFSTFTSKPSYE